MIIDLSSTAESLEPNSKRPESNSTSFLQSGSTYLFIYSYFCKFLLLVILELRESNVIFAL